MDPTQLTVEKLGDPHKAVTKFRVTSNLVLHTRINRLVTLWVDSINNKQFHP